MGGTVSKENPLLQDVSDALSKGHTIAQMNEYGRCTMAGFVVEQHRDAEAARVSYRWVWVDGEEGKRGRLRGTETMLYDYIKTLQAAGFSATMHIGPYSQKPHLRVVKK
jgi:hypothetical protein